MRRRRLALAPVVVCIALGCGIPTTANYLILVTIAVPSFKLLFLQQTIPPAVLTVKAVGKQWYWSYGYPDSKFEFDSIMLKDNERKPDQPRLLAVDNEIVVPVNKTVRVQVIGADVIHAFAVPSFGIIIDAVPGRLNETWFKATREGVYYGQCSELCGKDHAFMPIEVRVVSEQAFTAWVEEQKKKYFGKLLAEPIMASYATSEPDAGSDVAGMKTRFAKHGDDYVLNGQKCWITNARTVRLMQPIETARTPRRSQNVIDMITTAT